MSSDLEDRGVHGEGFQFLNMLRDRYHGSSVAAGWWAQLEEVKSHLPEHLHAVVEQWYCATKIALIHSEVSEMMEGLRKGLKDDHLPYRDMEEVEASDILIRLFDYAGFREMDLAGSTYEKGEYNQGRADHKITTRAGEGGKKF